MKVLVAGSEGMLGSEVCRILEDSCDLSGFDYKDLDIRNKGPIRDRILDGRPDCVVNCAAYTDVDGAESNRDEAFAVNGNAVGYIASASNEVSAIVIHISTDYVFDGKKGSSYLEEDDANPIGAYGASKLEGERVLISTAEKYFILRASWLYGIGGKNFVKTILRYAEDVGSLKVVDDQTGSPTYVCDLARIIKDVIFCESKDYGIYHANNAGGCTWYEFACTIVKMLEKNRVQIEPVPTSERKPIAQRPKYSVMDNSKIAGLLGYGPRPWKEAFEEFVKDYKAGGPRDAYNGKR